MKWKLMLFFIIVLQTSCCVKNKSLAGNYSSVNPSWFAFLSYDFVTLGNSLKIEKDSTFILTNCAYNIYGTWTVKNNKLYLTCLKKEFKIDSLNTSILYSNSGKCDTIVDVYVIKRKYLKKTLVSNNSKFLSKLKKEE